MVTELLKLPFWQYCAMSRWVAQCPDALCNVKGCMCYAMCRFLWCTIMGWTVLCRTEFSEILLPRTTTTRTQNRHKPKKKGPSSGSTAMDLISKIRIGHGTLSALQIFFRKLPISKESKNLMMVSMLIMIYQPNSLMLRGSSDPSLNCRKELTVMNMAQSFCPREDWLLMTN